MKRIMSQFRFTFGMFLLLQLGFFFNTESQQLLRGYVPSAVTKLGLQSIGRIDSTKHLHLNIGLPLRNQQGLTDLLQQIYDPANPNFRQYLTPEQFTAQFGPTEQDYQAVIAFAKANGFERDRYTL